MWFKYIQRGVHSRILGHATVIQIHQLVLNALELMNPEITCRTSVSN